MIKKNLSRRNLLQLGTSVISAGVAVGVSSYIATPKPATAKNIVTPD
jgi:hypothetical protein